MASMPVRLAHVRSKGHECTAGEKQAGPPPK
jgi:hypothetical protein